MQTSVQCRRAEERSLGMMMKEIDEDLALFLEMRGRENEKNDLIFHNSPPVYDDSTESNPDSSMASGTTPLGIPLNTFFDTLLDDPENAQSDFDWLLSPSFSPSAPLIEAQEPEAPFQAEIPKEEATDLESEVLQPENTSKEISSTVDASEKTVTSTTSTSSSRRSNRRPISSGAGKSATSRLPTPSRRPLAASSKPSTSSTLNSKGTSCSTKPMAPPMKSSIPSKSAARSTSTPPARSALSSSSKKASARSVTPTPKPSSVSGPSIDKKTGSKTVTGSKTSHGVSPPVRSRPKVTSELLDAPPNTKFPMTKWPSLASKGRPTSGGSRQKDCTPLREKANVGPFNTMSNSYRVNRGYSKGNDDDEVNPVLEGTKMVERVVNMRKLAPPKDDYQPLDDQNTRKSSLDRSGFGRSLSKKSLDMAIRHMDITSGVPVNLNRKRIPASCVSSLSSGRVTKTGALFGQLTSTDSEDSVSSSSIVPDGCGVGSENRSSYF